MLQVRSLVLALLAIIVVSCQTDSNDFTPDLGGTGTGGSLAKFAIVQNSLLVLHENAIDQYFIQHDGSLTEGRSLTFFSGGLETIYPYGEYALVGSNNQVFFLGFDDNNFLDLISSYSHLTACDPVVAANGVAFSTLRNSGCRFDADESLDVIDIRDIETPVFIKSYNIEAPYGLSVRGSHLIVCERGGIALYGISDPYNIVLKGFFDFGNDTPLDVIHAPTHLIVRTDKGIYNVSYTDSGVFQILAKID
ncbi:hypothetical protein [Roseivirga thermotolerans]|uniref:LVIVD repeat-containing protein n=1 Tax=Roseivirga thermotolerans TaxID=1758176 RepID=A0ABQ3IBQ1_9BACT|nr:hypothetical protein [Roseivirga thermotolerans]GHE73736.1 hypothetical protein GCM10011340_33120 [Roseivirga thermotolerans]